MPVSTSKDEATHNRESREFELGYNGESGDHRKRLRECKKDLDVACTTMGTFPDNSA